MRAYTRPLMVSAMGSAAQTCRALEDLPMRAGKGEGSYNEAWLQNLIQQHPALLPIAEIEPGLAAPVPVCIELSIPSGYVDNLMLTPDGGIVVVETKLWRNPEARREVVGQILDYAKDLSRFSYEVLERQVGLARREPGVRLFPLVCPDAEPEAEARFIDAVSRNLRLGRFLLLIAGDGVQESAEQLGDFLQRHIGLHFTLALVEMSLWRTPGGQDVLVQPRVLAKTVQIERAVIRWDGAVGDVGPAALVEPTSPAASKPTTLSAETFFEQLEIAVPGMTAKLRGFLEDIESLGVFADVKRSLTLKWRAPDGREISLGQIDAQGRVYTDGCHTPALAIGRLDLCNDYKRGMAQAAGGAVEPVNGPMGFRLVVDGRTPRLVELLSRTDIWAGAIAQYVQGLGLAFGPT